MLNFHDDGVFCTGLSGFVTRPQALAAGFSWLAPILIHDPAATGNLNELTVHGSEYRREGWRLCGWGTYGQADTAANDARAAADICRNLGLDGWVANGEAWAEGALAGKSSEFIEAWKKEGAPCPLAVSCLSSDTASYARSFDYASWLAFGSVIMPQVYGNDKPGLTVGAALGMLAKARVPQSMMNLTFGTYPVNGVWRIPYDDYQGWSGPRTVYVGDATPANAWPRLSRAAARPNTPPKEDPVPTPTPPKPVTGKSLTEKQVPYTGPYGLATGKLKSKGPTAEALKRALSRAGAPTLPWREFDPHYNQALEQALDWMDRGLGLTADNNGYGSGRWERVRKLLCAPDGPQAGQHALDQTALLLIQNEAGATSDSDPLANLQHYITLAAAKALANASKWRYNNEFRPVPLNIDPANPTKPSDCSGSIIQLVDRARRDAGLEAVVQDPARQGWSGYGNTDRYMDDWPKVTSPFWVGDLAHFFSERHVIMCIKAGTVQTAEWWSFGHEPPVRFRLPDYARYPSEYMFTVRPEYLPEPL